MEYTHGIYPKFVGNPNDPFVSLYPVWIDFERISAIIYVNGLEAETALNAKAWSQVVPTDDAGWAALDPSLVDSWQDKNPPQDAGWQATAVSPVYNWNDTSTPSSTWQQKTPSASNNWNEKTVSGPTDWEDATD